MMRLRNASVVMKLTALAIVAVCGLAVLVAIEVSHIRPDEMTARRTKLRNLVEAAQSVVAGYQQQEVAGKLTTEQAKRGAIAAVKVMRYDQKEYFWINDMTPKMIMHPIKPELDGTDLRGNKDPHGKYLFVEFVKTVQTQGAGYVDYYWPKPGQQKPVAKLSYVSQFAPWGWVIGTGVYIDDVDAAVAAKRGRMLIQSGIATGVIAVVLLGVCLSITGSLRRVTRAIRRLADGEVGVELPEAGRDEIGQMIGAMRILQQSLVEKQNLEHTHAQVREQAEADKRAAAASLVADLQATVSAVLDRVADASSAMQEVSGDLSATTENLVSSVRAIAGRAQESTTAAGRAAQEASDVTGTVAGLTAAADTIGGVIEVIRGVAAQTNLLALNATIEAARAGELGKGFAVVANEVKELAQQSAAATDQIAREVEAIQATSQEAATVMGRMAETVSALGSATQEVAGAITGTDGNVGGMSVQESAAATGTVAQRIQEASGGLATEADRLRHEFAALLERFAAV
jgi:methyl-accepting chemotaxis protein